MKQNQKSVIAMKVLFVCSGNAHRSPLAEALLKKLRPDWQVDSAGVHVAIPVSPEVKEYLAKKKVGKYLKKVPESLDSKRLSEYDLIFVMEQRHKEIVLNKCPSCTDKVTVWNIEDPYFMQREDAEKIYRQIEERVTELSERFAE